MQTKTYARMFLLAVIAALSAFAHAQGPDPGAQEPQRAQALELTYDYVHTNGPPHACGCFSLNGAGVAYAHPVGSSSFDFVGRLGVGRAGSIGANNLGLTLTTYTVGARYYPRWKSVRWQSYAELQVGGAYAGGNLLNAPNPGGGSGHSAFAGTAGGGIELLLTPRVSLKLVDVQYLTTTFTNGDTDHQNSLRESTGLVFRFGKSGK